MDNYLLQSMKQPDIDLIRSMKQQMTPSLAARSVLEERLAAEAPKKEKPNMKTWKPLALAACAALVLCAYPAYNALKPQPQLHAYTVIQASEIEQFHTTVEEGAEIAAGDIGGAYISDPNAGDLPDPSGDDIPTQPGADAYQLLMDHFGGTLPDWYGGAYITRGGTLMVLLVSDKDPGDKTLELEVLEAAGGKTAPVAFAGAKYSRNHLKDLNEEVLDLVSGTEIFAGMGIYDDLNRIVLDLSATPTDDILARLAELDPDGDAIEVRVVEGGTTVTDGPADLDTIGLTAHPNGGVVDEEEGEEPAAFFAAPGGVTVPDDEDLEAIEPFDDGEITDLPQKKQPALETTQPAVTHDLLPIAE